MAGPTKTTKEWRLVILCATFLLIELLVASECEAQAIYEEASATLLEKVQIPVAVNGKEVGKTSLPAGTKVTVVSRDGASVSIKRGNLGPVWVEESQLS